MAKAAILKNRWPYLGNGSFDRREIYKPSD